MMCPKPSVSLTSRWSWTTLSFPRCSLSEVHYFQTFFEQSSEVAFHRLEAKRLADERSIWTTRTPELTAPWLAPT